MILEKTVSFEQIIEQVHSVIPEFQRTELELHDNMNKIIHFNAFRNEVETWCMKNKRNMNG